MPHYYFDVNDGEQHTIDDCGFDCLDIEAAQREAFCTLSEIAHLHVPGSNSHTYEIRNRDETEKPVILAKLALTSERL